MLAPKTLLFALHETKFAEDMADLLISQGIHSCLDMWMNDDIETTFTSNEVIEQGREQAKIMFEDLIDSYKQNVLNAIAQRQVRAVALSADVMFMSKEEQS